MQDLIAIVILGVIVAGAWLWVRWRSDGKRGAESQLRRICLGDNAQVERLIANETARAPGISRDEAASRAVQRYQRDNR